MRLPAHLYWQGWLCRAVPIFSLCVARLSWRILAEEKVLLVDLAGYYECCQEMRYRLLPRFLVIYSRSNSANSDENCQQFKYP